MSPKPRSAAIARVRPSSCCRSTTSSASSSPARRVVDLGAAPGGWTQVAVERVKPERGRGVVVGIDLTPVEPIAGATVLAKDFYDEDAPAAADQSCWPDRPTWC